jgi:glutathione synthase/RimK-type ligase-like ATP-grasp enzyme
VIVAVSYPGEEHTDAVVELLREQRREVVRLDLADFPLRRPVAFRWSPGGPPAWTIGPDESADGAPGPRAVDLAAARVVWWRRVRPFDVAGPADPAARAFAASETDSAVLGALDALPATWVNPRAADEAAHRKPLQWTHARAAGLDLPDTLVTTDPGRARRFVARHGAGGVVYKALLAVPGAWRETRLVTTDDLARLGDLRLAPVTFQEYVPGVDLRVTVVGDQVFTAEIDATATSYPVDMRMVLDEAAMRPAGLPAAVEKSLLALTQRLGLTFGAADLRRRPDGRHVFLELNPAGQWLFVEARTGQPITSAVAGLLARLDQP